MKNTTTKHDVLQARHVDFPEIVTVWEAAVRATHDFLSEEDIAFFRPLILNEYLAAVTLRVVKNEQGAIVGFLGTAEDKVEMLFVAPEAMNQGIGRCLLKYAITHLGATSLDVNEHNPGATAFYQRCGFVVTGRSEVDGMGKPFPVLHMKYTPA